MIKKRRSWQFAKSRNSLIILALSLCSFLLLLTSGDKIGLLNEEPVLKRGLDSEQIRRDGHRLYNANCLNCHGVSGRGTSFGPPLIHALYGAETLSDQAFVQAVLYGAPERHWQFGPMQAIDGRYRKWKSPRFWPMSGRSKKAAENR